MSLSQAEGELLEVKFAVKRIEGMIRSFFYLLSAVLFLALFSQCETENKNTQLSKESNESLSLNKTLQQQIEKDAQDAKKIIPTLKKEGEEKKKAEEEKNPDDGTWVLLINGIKVTQGEFEQNYNLFKKLSPNKVSKKDYSNIFVQNYLLKQETTNYFSMNTRKQLVDFVRKQTVIQKYISDHAKIKPIKNPTQTELYEFFNVLIQQEGFKTFSLSKDRAKIIQMYKNAQMNKDMMQFEKSVKSSYRITLNDEWEEGLVEKYINKQYDRDKAMGPDYKKYWIYKLLLGKPQKTKILTTSKNQELKTTEKEKSQSSSIASPVANKKIAMADELPGLPKGDSSMAESLDDTNSNIQRTPKKMKANNLASGSKQSLEEVKQEQVDTKSNVKDLKQLFAKQGLDYTDSVIFSIKDIEEKINLMDMTNLNPTLVSQFRNKPEVRKEVLKRYLLEELIYKTLKDTNQLSQSPYRETSDSAVQNFMQKYYLENVLKLHSLEQKRQYFMNLLNKQKIRASEKYFSKE